VREEYKDFTKWWKDVLPSEDIESVKVSNRLTTTPCAVVTSKYGWSANMERIMKAGAYTRSHFRLNVSAFCGMRDIWREIRDI